VSFTGRWVAFGSRATNLVPNDTNGRSDVFVRDRSNRTTERVSLSSGNDSFAGNQGDDASFQPDISADGQHVAFLSWATNLAGSGGALTQVYLRNRIDQSTQRVSVSSAEVSADQPSFHPSVSANGRFVAFDSAATNLVAGDTNGTSDVFVRNTVAGTTIRVSVKSDGTQADLASERPSISDDGRFVAFETLSALVPSDTNGSVDIYVWDRATGSTSPVSVTSKGLFVPGQSRAAAISGDGTKVAFWSDASSLVPGDTNGREDVFIRDLSAGTTVRVSLGAGGVQANGGSRDPSLTTDGSMVAFYSHATNLVANDTNAFSDIFVVTPATGAITRASRSTFGIQSNGPSVDSDISGNGLVVVFFSWASNLVSNDTNGVAEVFARR
jgi:Tol biopolymer transport system component